MTVLIPVFFANLLNSAVICNASSLVGVIIIPCIPCFTVIICNTPGSITPHTKFKASVYVLKKDEGGRHTPFFNGYRPQFYFRTTDVTGVATLPEGTEMVMPGDNVELEVELIIPIAMDKELRFAIREGGHTVGAGVVTEIVE